MIQILPAAQFPTFFPPELLHSSLLIQTPIEDSSLSLAVPEQTSFRNMTLLKREKNRPSLC